MTKTRKTITLATIIAVWILAAHLTGFWIPNEGPSVLPCYTCTFDD